VQLEVKNMDMKIIALVFVLIFAFSGCTSAMSVQNDTFSDVDIYRIYPESAYIGQKAWITIAIENTGAEERTIEITEKLGDAEFDKSDVQDVNTTFGSMYLYEWELYLPAGENTSVSYWIEPRSAGSYVISPSQVMIDGKEYRMKSAVIAVGCLADNACGQGENYLNCPQDCESGAADGVCDQVSDGKCDPDCASGFDADCPKTNGTSTNITQNISGEANETVQTKEPGTGNAAETDFASYIPYLIGIVVVAAAALYVLRKKR